MRVYGKDHNTNTEKPFSILAHQLIPSLSQYLPLSLGQLDSSKKTQLALSLAVGVQLRGKRGTVVISHQTHVVFSKNPAHVGVLLSLLGLLSRERLLSEDSEKRLHGRSSIGVTGKRVHDRRLVKSRLCGSRDGTERQNDGDEKNHETRHVSQYVLTEVYSGCGGFPWSSGWRFTLKGGCG